MKERDEKRGRETGRKGQCGEDRIEAGSSYMGISTEEAGRNQIVMEGTKERSRA